MRVDALRRRELVVDGRPHYRMGELESGIRSQQLRAHEVRGCRGRGHWIQSGERGRELEIGALAEDRDGPCQASGSGRKPGETQRDGPRNGLWPDVVDTGGRPRRRGHAVSDERRQQRLEIQRVAARCLVTSHAELGLGHRLERLPGERGHRLRTENAWAQDERRRVGQDLVEQRRLAVR